MRPFAGAFRSNAVRGRVQKQHFDDIRSIPSSAIGIMICGVLSIAGHNSFHATSIEWQPMNTKRKLALCIHTHSIVALWAFMGLLYNHLPSTPDNNQQGRHLTSYNPSWSNSLMGALLSQRYNYNTTTYTDYYRMKYAVLPNAPKQRLQGTAKHLMKIIWVSSPYPPFSKRPPTLAPLTTQSQQNTSG